MNKTMENTTVLVLGDGEMDEIVLGEEDIQFVSGIREAYGALSRRYREETDPVRSEACWEALRDLTSLLSTYLRSCRSKTA